MLLIILCAFRSGADRYYLKKAVGLNADGSEVFYYFRPRNILRLIKFYFSFYAVKLTVAVFCFLPFIVLLLFINSYVYSGDASAAVFNVYILTAAVLFVHGIVFFFRFNSFFFVARYRFASGHPDTMLQLLSFSYKCIKGNRMAVLSEKLSFIPWFISCVFLLPISFVRAHYNHTMAQLAADLMQKHLQKQ